MSFFAARTRGLRVIAAFGVVALLASLMFVASVAHAGAASAAAKPTLKVTPIGTNKVRVEGKYPHKVNGKVTALYVMACAKPGKNRPSSQYCVADWGGTKSGYTLAPKDATEFTKNLYGDVLTQTGTVKNGMWSFAVTVTLPKTMKVNGKTIKCTNTNGKCGIGTRLSVTAGIDNKSADKFVVPSKKKSTVSVSAKSLKAGKAGKATVSVKTVGVAKPTGKIKIKVGSKSVTKTLKATNKGKVSITLPKLKKGKHTLKVTFTPSGAAKHASKTSTKTIKVTVK